MPYEEIQESALTSNSSTAQDTLGKIRKDPTDDRKLYKYVQFTKGVPAVLVGDAVGYVSTTGYSASMVSGDVSTTDSVLAGFLVAALTDQYYGWIQIAGLVTLSTALVSGSAGNLLTLSTTTDCTLKAAAADTDAGGAICVTSTTVAAHCVR